MSNQASEKIQTPNPKFFEKQESIEFPFKLPSGLILLATKSSFEKLMEAIRRDFPQIQIVKARQSQKRLWLSTTDELQELQGGGKQ